MTPSPETEEERPRSRARDFWQLDVPLVIALVICSTATVIELSRAIDGNWRAWVYSFEWPMIGAFCVWMWIRFRRQGASVSGMTQKWRDRAASFEEEARRDEESREPVDPDLAAWQEYQRGVRNGDRAGGAG